MPGPERKFTYSVVFALCSEPLGEEINEKVANNRIAADQLDKTYLSKFKKILSSKKIFLVQRAEMRFHREMIKGMNRKGGGNDSKRK